MKLRITAGAVSFGVALADTPTAAALFEAAPFESKVQVWGEEVYFHTPVSGVRLEPGARQIVDPGTVCFWTQGDAIALPFGPTPISTDGRPKLASPCNILGTMQGDARMLAKVRAGQAVKVEKA